MMGTVAKRKIIPVGRMGIQLVHPHIGDVRLTGLRAEVFTASGWVARDNGRIIAERRRRAAAEQGDAW